MKCETLKGYCDEDFRCITGVKRVAFGKMLEILCREFEVKHAYGGRKPKLSIEE
jgi:hypothetical protein